MTKVKIKQKQKFKISYIIYERGGKYIQGKLRNSNHLIIVF